MTAITQILARVRTRPAAVFLLVYQTVFLNVVLPGHTRGAITLDGRHTGDRAVCCCGDVGDKPADDDRRPVPSQRDRDHCSICNFAARVVPPTLPDLRLVPLGLVDRLPSPRPATVDPADRIVTYYGRGPPTHA